MLHTKYKSCGPHDFREEHFLSFSHYHAMGANDPLVVASFGPRSFIGRIYVLDHLTLLHTKHISCGPHSFREEDFLSFFHYKYIGAISQHGGHLDLRTVTIFTNFQSPFNTRRHIKFEEIWPRGFREVVQRCGQTDGRTDG